jgi:hypothetical protein
MNRMKTAGPVLLVALLALAFGIRKARAQTYETQPFTAIETTVNSGEGLIVPSVDTGVIAVSGDGKTIARLHKSEFSNSPSTMTRWVIDAKNKRSVFVDHGAKMLVNYEYHEQYVSGPTVGGHCEGAPNGQIEGFDVTLIDTPMGNRGANKIIRKLWAAPKLGCFVIREERQETDLNGKLVRSTVHTLTNIVIGEPDPSYFDTSLPEGFSETKPEDYKGAVVNHKNAQQKQQ